MSVVMARIDNRLLHGIIVTQWAPVSGATRVFVIAKEPETILHLVESGIELPSLIVGGSLVKEGGVQLTQRAYASTENVQSYKALIARGVKVTAQFVPADKPVSVADLI